MVTAESVSQPPQQLNVHPITFPGYKSGFQFAHWWISRPDKNKAKRTGERGGSIIHLPQKTFILVPSQCAGGSSHSCECIGGRAKNIHSRLPNRVKGGGKTWRCGQTINPYLVHKDRAGSGIGSPAPPRSFFKEPISAPLSFCEIINTRVHSTGDHDFLAGCRKQSRKGRTQITYLYMGSTATT